MSALNGNATIHAYRRENGRVGVRNHVVILPLDDISNAACEAPMAGCSSARISICISAP
jgi:(2R)-sulfolactate sulfo-lyase subunit beta